MSLTSEFPVREPIVTGGGQFPWLITDRWRIWLRDLLTLIRLIPARVATVELDTQNASIVTTPINDDSLDAGLYRVTWYAAVTLAAGVSSSLTVTLGWTDQTIAKAFAGAAMTGNTTATTQSYTQMIRIDQASPITYTTTYASNAAGAMQYSLDVVLEVINA